MQTRPVARDPDPVMAGTMPLLAPYRKDSAKVRISIRPHAPDRPFPPQNAFTVALSWPDGPQPLRASHAIVAQHGSAYIAS
jgi:hypothetical protein